MDEPSGDGPAAQTASRRRFLLQGAALGTALAAPGLLALPRSRGGVMGAGVPGSSRGANSISVPRPTRSMRRLWTRKCGAPRVVFSRRPFGWATPTRISAATAFRSEDTRATSRATFCVRPGDTLRIKLINALPPNPDAVPVDQMLPHHFNTTNLHFHGGHLDPGGISGNGAIFSARQRASSSKEPFGASWFTMSEPRVRAHYDQLWHVPELADSAASIRLAWTCALSRMPPVSLTRWRETAAALRTALPKQGNGSGLCPIKSLQTCNRVPLWSRLSDIPLVVSSSPCRPST
jgi:hypothetical protein